MPGGIRRHYEALDYAEIARRYPPPARVLRVGLLRRTRGHGRPAGPVEGQGAGGPTTVPFHRGRWDAAGFHPSHIKTLDDLWRVPFYTIDDIRKSIDDNMPFGDYQGVTPAVARREPMRVYMSGGTTGKSRPTFYTRGIGWSAPSSPPGLYHEGIRPGDVVLNSWSYGTHNGAFCFDEALYEWLNCVVLTTSTGNVTSTEKQVELAIQYGATAILTTGDYLLRIVEVARKLGYDPKSDLKIRALPNIGATPPLGGVRPRPLPKLRLPRGAVGGHRMPAHDGLHIYEDGFIVQIVDVDTGEPLPDGELGSLCVTELYKTGSPQFRYNIMDLSYLYPKGQCACGSGCGKMGPFAGRGDNMVKLRGVNVWPEAVGDLACSVDGTVDRLLRAGRAGQQPRRAVDLRRLRPQPGEFAHRRRDRTPPPATARPQDRRHRGRSR